MDDTLKIKIEAYLSGNMSSEEESLFEELMNSSSSLKREVVLARQVNLHLGNNFIEESIPYNDLTQRLRKELRTDGAKELKKKLQEVKDAYITDTSKKRFNSKVYLIAASIAFLLVSTISLIFFTNQNKTEKLFAQYYSTSDLPSIIKRNSNQDFLVLGVTKFNEANYKEALSLFESYQLTSSDVNPSVNIYSGIAYWEIDQIDKALVAFDKMVDSNTIDASKGLWFKALLYLKIKDKEQAKVTLLAITKDTTNFKYSEAKELLSKL